MAATDSETQDQGCGEHPLVSLARLAVEEYVNVGLVVPVPSPLAPAMQEKAGVFVSIKKRGELRGCIGTFEPAQDSIAAEAIHNAVSAAVRDPRFPPVRKEELGDLSFSVDVLTSPEPVSSPLELDPRRFGVLVTRGFRRGLLLPDLEGVVSVAQQLEIACYKAGIAPNETVEIRRFEVRRYGECH